MPASDDEPDAELPLREAAHELIVAISDAHASGLSVEEIAEAGGLTIEEVERILDEA